MIAVISAIFIASVIGSPHCAGMCGGIVALCIGMDQSSRRRIWVVPVVYNTGRLVTYATLGTVAGAFGAAVDFGGAAAGFQRTALVLAGVGMIAIGVVSLLRANGVAIGCAKQPRWMQRLMGKAFRTAYDRPPVARAGMIGLLTGFLPCGWLYAFLIVAAGTGSAAFGALAMSVFWAGTLPVMLSLGFGLRVMAGRFRRHVPTMTAIVLVLIGVWTVLGRFHLPALTSPAHAGPTSSAELLEQINSLNTSEMPCCNVNADPHK